MKKLSKKALQQSFVRFTSGYLSDMSFHWLMTFAVVDSMLPVVRDLYPDDKEEQTKGMQRHCQFFCTEPQLGTIILGIMCGLEEEKANGVEIDDDMMNSIKLGLMGPLAGIGDAMIPGMWIPLLLSIGIGLSEGGSILGPIFYAVTYFTSVAAGSYYLFMKGYSLGTKSVDIIIGETAQKVREALNLLGAVVVGGVGASYVSLNFNFSIAATDESAGILASDMVNGIYPKLLSLVIILFTWYLMSKKNVSIMKMLLILTGIAIVGVGVGIL